MIQLNKQKSVAFLRKIRLLKLVDTVMLGRTIARYRKNNRAFVQRYPDMQMPPYELMYDAYAHCGYSLYFDTGLDTAKTITEIIRRFIKGDGITVCEWGCGPARVIRHLQTVDPKINKVIGTDYNKHTIEWCKQALPQIEFHKNELAPPLPFPDNSLDVLYCISVFTHLSEPMHYAWINEIKRVLKPGGLFIGTFHGNKSAKRLLPNELAKYNTGELVVRDRVKEGSRLYAAFHSEQFVKDKLLTGFKNATQIDLDTWDQTIWCATKYPYIGLG